MQMDITYLGHSSFKIKTKTATVITDPFDPAMVGLKYPTNEADIITVSHNHADHNAVSKVTNFKKVIEGPGEYEVMGVSLVGYPSYHDNQKGAERGKNTIFVIEAEGLRLAHLGDIGHLIDDNLVNEMGEVDILMIPVGGFFTISHKEAAEIVGKIDPYFILPMHYKTSEMKAELSEKLQPVDVFLKEIGVPCETLPKFSIKKEDIIEDQSSKVIILEKK